MGSLAYLLLLPALFAAPPQIPIKVSKETTFITEPLAGDGLPNYALAIQESLKTCKPEENGAIPFWQAMGQCGMSDEEFERLTRAIGLIPDKTVASLVQLEDKSTKQAVVDWLRETGRSTDNAELKKLADEYIAWVQVNPWTDEDAPPLANWLADNQHALDLLVEASQKPEFYSPYPNLLVDRTVSVLDAELQHASGIRIAARALSARAMYQVAEKDLDNSWSNIRSCIALANHLPSGHMLVEQLIAMSVRTIGFKGTCVVLSQPDLSPTLARQIFKDLLELARPIDVSLTSDHAERLMALDLMLRMTTGRLGGMPSEKKDEDIDRIVRAGIDLNLSLRWINERFDRIVKAARIKDRKERTKLLDKLNKELEEEAERVTGLAFSAVAHKPFGVTSSAKYSSFRRAPPSSGHAR